MPINHTPTPVMQSGESRPGKAGLLSKSKHPYRFTALWL